MSRLTRVQNWSAITLTETDTFAAALALMSRGGYQLALVCRSDGRLAGMVTDSDIRKALLKGVMLEHSVTAVMNAAPLVVSPELGDAEAHQLMLINHFFHLPIVDADGHLVGLHVAEQLRVTTVRSETLVIMAGGRGKRLMPLTETVPKPMLHVKGKPMLEHILEHAKLDGFREIVLSVNYLSHVIKDYFRNGSSFGLNIRYIEEERPLGTAGSLSCLPSDCCRAPIVVTNADLMTTVSYSDMLNYVSSNAVDGLMGVRRQEWQNPFGVIHSKGNQLVGIEEKPMISQHINAGVYVLTRPLLDIIEKDAFLDMPDLFAKGLNLKKSLHVYPLHEDWVDIGRPEDYAKLSS